MSAQSPEQWATEKLQVVETALAVVEQVVNTYMDGLLSADEAMMKIAHELAIGRN